MKTVHRGRAVSRLVLALGAMAVAPAAGSSPPAGAQLAPTATVSAPRLRLPEPTGPHAVGESTLHLVDTSRQDPYVPDAGARELMVSMFYPARPGSGTPAPYMTPQEAKLLLESQGLSDVASPEAVSAADTHARTDTRPVPGRFPLIVLSPGFGQGRFTLTSLATDLASRGFVVASVDHAYESVDTVFSGGRALPCAACDYVDQAGDTGNAEISQNRAKDISFLLNRLAVSRPAWHYASMIDPERIGMAGHSIGGASAASTMAADRRVRAGVDMDGEFFDPVPAAGLDGRPFMLLGTDAEHEPGGTADPTWARDWPRLDGWRRWLTVAGSGHFSFTDFPVLAGELGIVDPTAPLPGERSSQITRDYVAAFFNLHLKAVPQPLLDRPTPGNPEVSFHQP